MTQTVAQTVAQTMAQTVAQTMDQTMDTNLFFSVLAWLPKRPKNRNPVSLKAPNAGLGI